MTAPDLTHQIAAVRRWALPKSTKSSGRFGSEWEEQWKLPCLEARLCHRITDQIWSPLLTERRVEWGFVCGSLYFSFARYYRIWDDGKEPRIERGRF